MNVWQRKIDDQRSVFQRVLPPKNALQTKRPVFYSPGEFTGRGSEAHLHKRKAEILRFRVKRELSSNLPPKRKNRPEDRSAENQENGRPFWGFPELFSSPQNDEIFESLKMGYFIISKNSLRDSQKFAQPQNRVCISQKRSQKDSNLRPLLAA